MVKVLAKFLIGVVYWRVDRLAHHYVFFDHREMKMKVSTVSQLNSWLSVS